MAKIKKNEKQQNALLSVTRKLSEIRTIDSISDSQENKFTLTSTSSGKSIRYEFDACSNSRVFVLLKEQRKLIAKEINSLCKEYSIELSEDELALLGYGD